MTQYYRGSLTDKRNCNKRGRGNRSTEGDLDLHKMLMERIRTKNAQ